MPALFSYKNMEGHYLSPKAMNRMAITDKARPRKRSIFAFSLNTKMAVSDEATTMPMLSTGIAAELWRMLLLSIRIRK